MVIVRAMGMGSRASGIGDVVACTAAAHPRGSPPPRHMDTRVDVWHAADANLLAQLLI
eukprot:m.282727 g.282727  ORF g.282727 m.282727 type:complete len:58 (-) comp26992_c0_seq1:30-203(-)